MLATNTLKELQAIANQKPQVEQCGVIYGGEIITLPNVHLDPKNNFQFHHKDAIAYLKKDGVIFWHSHTPSGLSELSVSDVVTAKFLGKPIAMVKATSPDLDYYDPKQELPLVGRTFRYAHRNCYTLVQDYYRSHLGIFLRDYFPKTPKEFFSDSPSKFLLNLERENFYRLPENEDLKVGDLILTTEQTNSIAWHCSILAETHPSKRVLSQWVSRPSGVIPYRAIANRIHSVWRYRYAG